MTFLRTLACLTLVGFLGQATTARASVDLFASFNQTDPGNPFTFDAVTGTMTGSAGVSFNFANQGAIDAIAVITMTTTQPVQEFSAGGNSMLLVSYDAIHLTVTAKTPIGGKTNLLTMEAGNVGKFVESVGGMTLDIGGQGDVPDVVFTSDFMTFSPTDHGTFSIGLISDAGVMKDPLTGFLTGDEPWNNPLQASVNSQFSVGSAPPTVPEPSSVALLVLGLVGVPLVLRRRNSARVSS
jgi:hypothetical protein